MEQIILVPPTEEWEAQILDYRREFLASGDTLAGAAGLQSAERLDAWFAALRDNASEETVREGMVPASPFLGVRLSDRRVVGMIDIRHRLNEYLLQRGGHIGYSVRASERQRGYAGEMLRQALGKCRLLGIDRVLITCFQDNLPSAKTIQNAGGVLENEILDGDRLVQRYWITLE